MILLPTRTLVTIIVMSFVALGCSSGGNESAKTASKDTVAVAQFVPPPAATTGDQKDTIPPNDQLIARTPPPQEPRVAKPEPKKPQPKPRPPTPEPERKITIPSGTTFNVRLAATLRTDSNQAGDPIIGTMPGPLDIAGVTVIPAGAEVRGHLVQVEEPHRTKGIAKMTLQFDSVADATGRMHALDTRPIVVEGEPDKVSDAGKVAIGGVVGGVIGALASKKKAKGAAIGAVAGAAAGGAVALATKGKQLELSPGHEFSVEVITSAEIPVAVKADPGSR